VRGVVRSRAGDRAGRAALARNTVETVGRGAEIVWLLDRSLSMDQPFGKPSNAVLDLSGQTRRRPRSA